MPTMEPTVEITEVTTSRSSQRYSLMNISTPSGMTRKPIHLMRLVSERIISDFGCLPAFLASMVSLETNESAPTAVRRARQPPLTTKLPERRLSPGFLTISSDSPVTSASLTRHSPETTSASAQIWQPGSKRTISSRTSCASVTCSSVPSRTTSNSAAAMIFSLSSLRCARRS